MKDKKYEGLKNYLNNHLDTFPSEDELEELIGYAVKTDAWENNVGYRKDRIEHCEREKAFHNQWLKENIPHSWINNGHGILQDLFIESEGFLGHRKIVEHITNRDRYIVATIIQWLGTNCGMCFLGEALERFGARIVYDKKPNSVPNHERSDATMPNSSNVSDNQEAIVKCDNPPCSNVKFNTLAGFNLCTCGWSEAIEPKGE